MYVLGGRKSDEELYQDTWYRDDRMPLVTIRVSRVLQHVGFARCSALTERCIFFGIIDSKNPSPAHPWLHFHSKPTNQDATLSGGYGTRRSTGKWFPGPKQSARSISVGWTGVKTDQEVRCCGKKATCLCNRSTHHFAVIARRWRVHLVRAGCRSRWKYRRTVHPGPQLVPLALCVADSLGHHFWQSGSTVV